jgi:uncharacterized short protein YbdD (DUF466 family)
MSQELTVIDNQNEVSTTSEFLDGFIVKPSNLVIVQGMTRDAGTARPGQLLDKRSGAAYDEITLVPLAVRKKRTLFPQGEENIGSKPLCRSNDGKKPVDGLDIPPPASTCARCPKAQWSNNKPPECKEKYSFLTITKDDGRPRYIEFGGTSFVPAREMLTSVFEDIQANARKGLNLSLYDYYFTVSLKKHPKRPSVYVANFSGLARVPEPGMFAADYDKYVTQARQAYADAEYEDVQATTEGVIDAQVVEV